MSSDNAFNASPSSVIEEHWRCIYQLICEHPSLIIQYGSSVLSSAQIQAISKNLGSLVNNINTVGKYDPTKVKTISKQGEKSIYMSIFAVFRVMNDAITSNPTKPMHVANADQKAAAIQQSFAASSVDTQKLFSAPVTPDIAPNYTSIVHHPDGFEHHVSQSVSLLLPQRNPGRSQHHRWQFQALQRTGLVYHENGGGTRFQE